MAGDGDDVGIDPGSVAGEERGALPPVGGQLFWPAVDGGINDQMKKTVQLLAEILGAPRQVQKPQDGSSWAAALFGVDPADLADVDRSCSNTQLLLHGYVLASWMDTHPDKVQTIGPHGRPAEWRPLDLGEAHTKSVPFHLSVHFPAGTLRPVGLVIHICGGYSPDVTVYAPPGHREVAESVLDDFRTALSGEGNPYRGRLLMASVNGGQIQLKPAAVTTETRSDLVLPVQVWQEVDLFLAAGTARRQELLELGLSTSRGLLLAGPPGVGKTKLGRILAAELQGTFTVIVVELEVLKSAEALYQEIERLGPTLVILEDIDAVATKTKRQSGVFSEFLNALDGARVRDGILTLATTNDPGSLDPAVKRPGRFDSIVEVPLPDAAARQQILKLYLARHGAGIDTAQIAAALAGVTGADIREVVRRGILEHGSTNLTTQALRNICHTGRWKPVPSTGNYL